MKKRDERHRGSIFPPPCFKRPPFKPDGKKHGGNYEKPEPRAKPREGEEGRRERGYERRVKKRGAEKYETRYLFALIVHIQNFMKILPDEIQKKSGGKDDAQTTGHCLPFYHRKECAPPRPTRPGGGRT